MPALLSPSVLTTAFTIATLLQQRQTSVHPSAAFPPPSFIRSAPSPTQQSSLPSPIVPMPRHVYVSLDVFSFNVKMNTHRSNSALPYKRSLIVPARAVTPLNFPPATAADPTATAVASQSESDDDDEAPWVYGCFLHGQWNREHGRKKCMTGRRREGTTS